MKTSHAALVTILLLTATAVAKPEPGDKHAPPLWLDVPSNWIQVQARSDGYLLQTKFSMVGMTSKNDRARIEVRSGKKVIAKADCDGSSYFVDEKAMRMACDSEMLTASGALEIDVIYIDDQTDKEFAVTTFKINVKAWKEGSNKGWTFAPDELLALTWVQPEDSTTDGRVVFHYWSTEKQEPHPSSLRCSVDGKKLEDIDLEYGRNQDMDEIHSDFRTGKTDKSFHYWAVRIRPYLGWGTKKENDRDTRLMLGTHPGAWACQVRRNGKPMRQLMFVVNDKGEIEPSKMQGGAKPVKNGAYTRLVDSRIPKESGERRVRPDALKKSVGFGVPWPDGEGAKEAQAAFPTIGKD